MRYNHTTARMSKIQNKPNSDEGVEQQKISYIDARNRK